jgi:hypothetical protein
MPYVDRRHALPTSARIERGLHYKARGKDAESCVTIHAERVNY